MNTKYKYNFTKTFYIIAILGGVISIASIVLNAVRLINLTSKNIALGFYECASLILSTILAVAFIVFIITAFISSYYEITDKQVVLKWGVIKNTVDLAEVKEINLMTNSKKLQLTFNDDSYFIIAVSNDCKEDFINEITKKFPKILYVQDTEDQK